MSHTKEPWIYGVGDTEEFGMVFGVGLPTLPNWTVVAVLSPFDQLNELDEANARRIVACVNACAGIDTSSLEIINKHGVTLRDMLAGAQTQMIDLEQQRYQLRAVCAEAYQLAGALDAPVEALDNLSAAANGNPLPHETFLPVAVPDVVAQRDQLLTAIINCRRTLEVVNEVPGGPINDTIWYGPAETLFDYMDSVIESASKIDFV